MNFQPQLCINCRHRRRRPQVVLFSPADLQTPGILKEQTQWAQEQRQRAEQEQQKVKSGEIFTYEPHHFDWCAVFTPLDLVNRANQGDQAAIDAIRIEGGADLDPVTGEFNPYYALCVQVNPDGECACYERK